jgi:alginate O-acetyltransferase complex protein AlgI
MLFSSMEYILFLLVVAVLWYTVPVRLRWLWLLACSTFFYFKLLPGYIILFFALIILNYYLAIAIERSEFKKNLVFILAICTNVSLLAFFKYFGSLKNIYIDINELSENDHLLRIFLPIGLSFFIFGILSYLIEVYRGTIKAERHFGIFASSLMFFPKIMQGPIERPGHLFHQFREIKMVNYDLVAEGVKLMLWGYFKKLVVADRIALYVNEVYGNFELHSGASLLIAAILYSFQIYADFSGYTDIALGSAKVLGFNLTNNFKRPYLAMSIKDFWERWHITFSSWLRDYVFLPIAYILAHKMRHKEYLFITTEKWIYLIGIMITFTICGIWHGVGWNYLIWGILFGLYLTFSNWTKEINKSIRKQLHIKKSARIYVIFNVFVTFVLVSFAWIFFRADSLNVASEIIRRIFTNVGTPYLDLVNLTYSSFGILLIALKDFMDEFHPGKVLLFNNKKLWVRYSSYMVVIFLIIIFGTTGGKEFIYFQF